MQPKKEGGARRIPSSQGTGGNEKVGIGFERYQKSHKTRYLCFAFRVLGKTADSKKSGKCNSKTDFVKILTEMISIHYYDVISCINFILDIKIYPF